MNKTAAVTEPVIVEALKQLGITAGDVAFVHSSMKSFGYVDGGPETVIDAFLKVLGTEGTLAVPVFRHYFWDGPDQVWDRQKSSCETGVICETLRLRPEAMHSPHAPHPIAAVGKLAEDLTERYNFQDFSDDSPFARLIELNAAIVMVGVSFSKCTLFHLFEEKYQVPYRRWRDLTGTVIDDGIKMRKTFPFYKTFIPGIANDFNSCARKMDEAGLIKKEFAGPCEIKMIRARDIADFIAPRIAKDPYFLVTDESRMIAKKYFQENP